MFKQRTSPPDRLTKTSLAGVYKMVHQRGLNSNRAQQLQVFIKDWVDIYQSPPPLDGISFRWQSPILS